VNGAPRYGIDELARLGGVSRRTVRYYVQERLLPPPRGVGRGDHYGQAHLDALLEVKAMQEAGLSLEAIRRAVSRTGPATAGAPAPRTAAPGAAPPGPRRSAWHRLTLVPGVELHVRGDLPAPPATALDRLTEWYRAHLARTGDPTHADD
jgi:DNA-binding transcriptional MerR regulator